MKISTWNVNSIRARIDNIKLYLSSSKPDIVLLQEIKTQEETYPFDEIKKLGYISYVSGQKSYNGVAILSKKKINDIDISLPGDSVKQARIISGKIQVKKKKINLINIYVPNGNPVDTEKYFYKVKWLDLLIKYLQKKIKNEESILVCGDFNIIPEDIDVYAPEKYENDALFRIEIRKKYRQIINLGFTDTFRLFNKKQDNYTFWDYTSGSWQKNNGLRIDHLLATNNLIDQISKVEIKKNIRKQTKPSDHVPVECTFI
ncbi:exodeoxyribonuclease III [Pelagibacteraceae bacterium]|nr:exodeoxyribonuclease III [Pelagibacteraceae bacterium]